MRNSQVCLIFFIRNTFCSNITVFEIVKQKDLIRCRDMNRLNMAELLFSFGVFPLL